MRCLKECLYPTVVGVVACLAMSTAVWAMQQKGAESRITEDGRLVIEGRTITTFQVDGSRCVMATGTDTALSCDHTYAIRQGEERIKP